MRLTPEEVREQRDWSMRVLRLSQSGNRAGLHAELLRQESSVIDLLQPDEQERFRASQ